jgi:hypothetical protein
MLKQLGLDFRGLKTLSFTSGAEEWVRKRMDDSLKNHSRPLRRMMKIDIFSQYVFKQLNKR